MSARVTSDPSQPEHPGGWAILSSSRAEVAVILEEAIEMARTGRESQSPVLLDPSRAGKRGNVSLSGKQISQQVSRKVRSTAAVKSKVMQGKILGKNIYKLTEKMNRNAS
jgi:hypothetical protein